MSWESLGNKKSLEGKNGWEMALGDCFDHHEQKRRVARILGGKYAKTKVHGMRGIPGFLPKVSEFKAAKQES